MSVRYDDATKRARMDEVPTAAGVTAFLQVYDGAIPAGPTTAPAGTLLSSHAMSNPIAPPSTGAGVLTLDSIANDTGRADGAPTYARIAKTETGTLDGVADFAAGVSPGSGEELLFNAPIVTGATVSIADDGTITHG